MPSIGITGDPGGGNTPSIKKPSGGAMGDPPSIDTIDLLDAPLLPQEFWDDLKKNWLQQADDEPFVELNFHMTSIPTAPTDKSGGYPSLTDLVKWPGYAPSTSVVMHSMEQV